MRSIKEQLKAYGIRQYQLARYLGVSEFTVCRWLRDPISNEHKVICEKAIRELIHR